MCDESTTPEEWRPVPGYEGHYSVSNLGRVRSEARKVWHQPVGRKGYWRQVNERILSQGIDPQGRRNVILAMRGKKPSVRVHNIVLTAFIGPRPEGMVCCHYDGDAGNNRLENLRWDTRKSNTCDSRRHGTLARGERTGTSKLTEDQVRAIRADGASYAVIAEYYGVSAALIGLIKRRERWGWLE